jgi:hypothetical protein
LAIISPVAALLLILADTAAAQQAREVPYDYVEGHYVNTELDAGGWEAAGSLALSRQVYLLAGYLDRRFGGGRSQAGAGYRWTLRRALDVDAELAVGRTELRRRNARDRHEDGFIARARLRSLVREDVELNVALILDDSAGSDTNAGIEIGGQYFVDDRLSVGGRLRNDDQATSLYLGGRVYFR